jgi:Cu(I)/Ag(I) efflux system periplasmic protein CusF
LLQLCPGCGLGVDRHENRGRALLPESVGVRGESAVAAVAFGLSIALSPAQSPLIDGQVMKVDEAAGKITIRHGPIKRLDMDEGMTMVFKADDPAMLKQVKAGDKMKFEPDSVNGQFTVKKIVKVK